MAGLLDIITTKFLERAKSASSAGARFLGTRTGAREAFGEFSQKFLPGKQRFGRLDESTPELGNILGLINRLDVPEARRQALFQNLLRDQLATRQEAFGFQATSGAPPELPQQQQPRIQGTSIEAPQPQQFTPGDPSTLRVLSGQQQGPVPTQLDNRGAVVNAQQTLGLSQAEADLLNSESGFRPQVKNPTSSAFGIGQMINSQRAFWGKFLGIDPNTIDPHQQVQMARAYIENRYINAENALAFKRATVRKDPNLAPDIVVNGRNLRETARQWIKKSFTGY